MLLETLKRRGGRAALLLAATLVVGGTSAAVAYLLNRGKAGIPGGPRLGPAEEMHLVPGEAFGFVHIRLGALRDTEGFAEVRKVIETAGPRAKAVLDENFVPAPSALDRVTLVYVKVPPIVARPALPPPPPPKNKQPRKNKQPPRGAAPVPPGEFPDNFIPPIDTSDLKVIVLLAYKAPFDVEKVRAAHAKAAVQKKIGDRDYWEDTEADVALYAPNSTTLALGDVLSMKSYLTKLAATGGPLIAAIEHAQEGGRHVVAAINFPQLGVTLERLDRAEGEHRDAAVHARAALKMDSLTLGVALTDEGTRVELRAKYKDAAAAAEAETALRELAKLARTKLNESRKGTEKLTAPDRSKWRPVSDLPEALGGLFGLESVGALSEWLADPPLKVRGPEVLLARKVSSAAALSTWGASIGLLPAAK